MGSALACALAELPLDVVLVEAREVAAARAAELRRARHGARERLAADPLRASISGRELKGYTEAIRSIHISERGRFGAARIEAAEQNVPALGYTVENQTLGRVLWDRLQRAPRLTVLAPGEGRPALACASPTAPSSRSSAATPSRPCARSSSSRPTARARPCATRSASRPTSTTTGSAPSIFNCSTEAPLDGPRVRALHGARADRAAAAHGRPRAP